MLPSEGGSAAHLTNAGLYECTQLRHPPTARIPEYRRPEGQRQTNGNRREATKAIRCAFTPMPSINIVSDEPEVTARPDRSVYRNDTQGTSPNDCPDPQTDATAWRRRFQMPI